MTIPIPQGFRFAGVHCGLKADNKEDISLIVSDRNAVAAGVYTQNIVYAAPVEIDRSRTPMQSARFVVVNSGNANACTGEQGLSDAHAMIQTAATATDTSPEQGLVMSTGVIGVFLDMEKITSGVKAAASKLQADEPGFLSAARGILTTDKGLKIAGGAVQTSQGEVRIAGMAKGAGMIGPNMATMLCAISTDAALSADDAQAILSQVVDHSFNCISVEGHTSTNDTVLLLANGAATAEPLQGEDRAAFVTALQKLCIELARMIPDDGEGASHLINLHVRGCDTRDDARRIAKAMAESALVRTAIAGADPNWGRIVSAAGYAGVPFNPSKLSLRLNDALLYEHGAPVAFDAAAVSNSIKESRETFLELDLNTGEADIRFWTSDLNADYVRFNSEYTT